MAFSAPGLYSRVRTMLPELIKFGIVGGIGTVVDLGGAALLHGKYHVEPLAAKAVSTGAATVITYLGSRFWTFKHRENQELKREAVLFIVLNLVGLLIAEVVVGFVTYVISLHGQLEYNFASLLGTGFGTIFRYFAYKKWVFLAPAAHGDDAAAPAARRFPDYPPWELDPAFLARSQPALAAPVAATSPVTAPASWGQQPTAAAPAPTYFSPWEPRPAAPVQEQVPEPEPGPRRESYLDDEPPPYAWEPTEHMPLRKDENGRLAAPERPGAPAPQQQQQQQQRRPAGRHRRR